MNNPIRINEKSPEFKFFNNLLNPNFAHQIMMKGKIKRYSLFLSVLLLIGVGKCFADTNLDAALRQIENQNRKIELEDHRAKIRSLQFEAVMARVRAETDQINAQLDARKAEERADQAAAQQEENAKMLAEKSEQAERAANELKDQMARASVRTRNDIYLALLIAVLVGLATFVIKIKRRMKPMNENEKFGLVAILVSFLCALLFLMMSSNWAYSLDLINNLMITLTIQFFHYDDPLNDHYLIDFPTKYLILLCMSVAAYGVTTYLGITPIPRREMFKRRQESKGLSDS